MRRLTPLQIQWLRAIDGHTATYAILALRGKAKRYAGRYQRSFENAVQRHNLGQAPNSPLPAGVQIQRNPVGPKGGQGYYLTADAVPWLYLPPDLQRDCR